MSLDEGHMKYIKLKLAGVFQSYSSSENIWRTRKDTKPGPTKSAVTGLIACAMGLRKGDKKYTQLEKLDYSYRAGIEDTNERKNLKKGHIMDDYQIIRPKEAGKSFEDSYFWRPDGKHNGIQLPTYKEYIVDAEFTVYVGSENESLLKKIHAAFTNPVWPVYLGRACCTPSSPIVDKEVELLTEEEIDGSTFDDGKVNNGDKKKEKRMPCF